MNKRELKQIVKKIKAWDLKNIFELLEMVEEFYDNADYSDKLFVEYLCPADFPSVYQPHIIFNTDHLVLAMDVRGDCLVYKEGKDNFQLIVMNIDSILSDLYKKTIPKTPKKRRRV